MHEDLAKYAVPEILHRPREWQLIATGLPPEVAAIAHPRHRRWMATHTHQHAHIEVLFVLDGHGHHGVGGDIYPLAPGTICCFDAFAPHDDFVPPWTSDGDRLWMMFFGDGCMVRRHRVVHGEVRWDTAWDRLLDSRQTGLLHQRLLTSALHPGQLSPTLCRERLHAIMAILLTAVLQSFVATSAEEDDLSFQQRIVATMRRHIEQTAGHGITLDHLARISGYSKFHLSRLFKQYTGNTVHQYIDRCRRVRVRELLAAGHSLTAIAQILGFSCQPAFSRWYRHGGEKAGDESGALPVFTGNINSSGTRER